MSDPRDAALLTELGPAFLERLRAWMAAGRAGEGPVLARRDPLALGERWPGRFDERVAAGETGPRALALLEAALDAATHLHHRRYVGHQVATPLPLAALFELVGALLNNGMAVYEMGQLQTVCERGVVRWMADELGLGPAAGGLFTSGGSLGNLTALLAARQARTGSWGGGSNGARLALLVSEESHYSVARAAQVMGWGKGGVVRVPTDAAHRMDVAQLPARLAAARKQRREVVCVVASACSTATGAFDPLEPIADFCAEHGLWLHVDGAHGATHALSRKHRDVLRGVERADSVVWDAHKLMQMPALSTAVLFREERHALESFAQEARYLFEDDTLQWDGGRRTVECTKRGMALTLYAALHAHGAGPFRDYLDTVVDLAHAFADELEAAPDFELCTRPETNIVCFRHVPRGVAAGELDALQAELRRRVVDSGAYYLVQTRRREGLFLRTTLMNSATTLDDLRGLLEALRGAAREL